MELLKTSRQGRATRLLIGALLTLPVFAHVVYGRSVSPQITSLALSPHGTLLAVVVGNEKGSFIYEVSVDTGKATRLTQAKDGYEQSPAFSPDGERIAYTFWPSKGAASRIVILNVDGSNPHQWSPSGTNDFSPVFAPDDKTIVFSRSGFYGSYSPVSQPHPHAWGFYEANLDGTNVRQITNESFYMVSPTSVSPDGKSMVIATEGLETNRQIAIYSLSEPGPPTRTAQPHVPNEADHKDPILAYPNYLPDGNILFMAATNGKHGYDYDVYRLNLVTESVERLTHGNGYATDLKVSTDGKIAAFLKWRKNWLGNLVGDQVYLLELQTQRLRPLEITGLP